MKPTDWDSYYSGEHSGIGLTPRVNSYYLLNILTYISKNLGAPLNIVELGGANSCFFGPISKNISLKSYTILDNNELGLQKFTNKTKELSLETHAINADILHYRSENKYDVVCSFGLIEHFDSQGTGKAFDTHWRLLKSGGYLVLFFPTPTLLYRITRNILEKLGNWIFHDERPLEFQEVKSLIPADGTICKEFTIWPILVTQGVLVIKKTP